MTVVDAPPTRRRRTVVVWAVIVVLLVIVGALGAWLSSLGDYVQRQALDPESRAPEGARAIAEVLRDHGVTVEVVRTLAAARDALADPGATLALTDQRPLDDTVLDELADAAGILVALAPDGRTLDQLFGGSAYGGGSDDVAVPADCDLTVVSGAGDIAPGIRLLAGEGTTGCYPADGAYGLLAAGSDDAPRYALDAGAILDNQHLADGGNAALGVALLGGAERLVWYVPDAADPAFATGEETLADATPAWVTPAIVLLAAAAIAAMLWRGRRFGPLVAETLPVTVRAAETTAGRARLYAKAGDRAHAIDQLRIAASGRLAKMLSLGPAASAPEIADAAASRLGADPRVVRAVLLDDVPATDQDLVALAARLRHLEAAVRAAVTPGRTRP